MPALYQDRRDAGRALARRLRELDLGADPIALGLARGGAPVAYEAARVLDIPFDVFLVRKLGAPGQPELAMGAIAVGGEPQLNPEVVEQLGLTDADVQRAVQRERAELDRRQRLYRGDRPPPAIEGRTVVLIDDGLATGASMKAAAQAVAARRPERLIIAAPVGAPGACRDLEALADEVICVSEPQTFQAVGLWYRDFEQTTDDEVRRLLAA